MSGRAEKAVDDALALAEEMHADGQYRAAAIIKRVAHGNSVARTTCSILWRENMALRETVSRQAVELAELQSEPANA